MKLLRMEMEGFLSYKNLTSIDFAELDYASFTGENGAGKSTVPLAVTWAIFGTLRVRGDHDSVVNDEADDAVVQLEVEHDGQEWKIVRTRRYRGQGTVRVFQMIDGDWVQHGDHLNKTAQAQIDSIVGMSEDAWYSLVFMDYAKSAGGTRFTKADSETRRTILMDLLPEMDRWGALEARASERRREVRRSLERAETTLEDNKERLEVYAEDISSLEEQLDEVDADDLADAIASLDRKIGKIAEQLGAASGAKDAVLAEIRAARSEHDSRVRELRADIKAAKRAVEEFEEAADELKVVEGRISRQKSKIADLTEERADLEEKREIAQGAMDAAEGDIERLEGRLSALREEESEQRAALDSLQAQLDAMGLQDPGSGRCFVCDSKLSAAKFSDIVQGLHDERHEVERRLKSARGKVERLQSKLSDARDTLKRERRELRAVESDLSANAADLKNARERLADAESDRDDVIEEIDSADIKELRDELARLYDEDEANQARWADEVEPALNKKLEEVEGDEEADRLSSELSRLRAERSELDGKRSRADNLQGQLSTAEKSRSRIRKEIKEGTKEVGDLREQHERLEWLVRAFQPKGVPSMLLDSILGAIEDEQNRILQSLPGSEGMSVEFRQIKELKGGGDKDVLDIIVHTAQGYERPIESFSSGELVRLTISNLFAMISVFKQRNPDLVETLFLDEPLGPLDQEAVPAFIEVLRSAMNAGTVSSIFVVTHDQRVIDALPQRVIVSKDQDGGSRIDVVAK